MCQCANCCAVFFRIYAAGILVNYPTHSAANWHIGILAHWHIGTLTNYSTHSAANWHIGILAH